MRERFLVETDFLFGLNARDHLYPYVLKILEKHRRREIEITVSSAASIEAALIMLSRKLQLDIVVRALRLMEAKLVEYKVNTYASIALEVIAKALILKMKHPELTFFDSIHIALSTITNTVLITSDKTIAKVMEEEKLRYTTYRDIVP
ncbi:MAG: hypothetical protein J7K21_04255 [Desulfurococcales archaeon]|nr:hypothetical protein [Desulfurococcales archaeon]